MGKVITFTLALLLTNCAQRRDSELEDAVTGLLTMAVNPEGFTSAYERELADQCAARGLPTAVCVEVGREIMRGRRGVR